jgi:GTPase SAR1 family protein
MNHDELLQLIDQAARESWNELDLSGKQLEYLPPEVESLSKLQELNLSYNNFVYLPPEIGTLKNLHSLSLSYNYQLSVLPSEFWELDNLQQLDLSATRVVLSGNDLGKLKNLRHLDLSNNNLLDISDRISNADKIKSLNLSNNQLTKLPMGVKLLNNLQYLNISKNHIRKVEFEEAKFKHIKWLDISSNAVDSLPPEICLFKSLTWLDISDNKLGHLPLEVAKIPRLQSFNFDGNPLEFPPPEITKNGMSGVISYLRQQLEQGKEELYEAKLLILGEGGVGKTTLAKKIIDSSYELSADELTTEGIDVLRWNFKTLNGLDFSANIWDFGGQEIYHSTHQFFLTKRSLYIVLVDTRQNNADLYYWLNVVELLSDNSPVFILKNEKQDRQCEINERQLRGEFTNLEKVLTTNLATNRGLKKVKSTIQQRISQLPHVGTSLPKK